MSKSIYSTNITKCVVPHYKNDSSGESSEFFANWKMNSVFEQEYETYMRKGHKISSAMSGLCEADLFYYFGLVQRDEYVRTLFSAISCFTGKDSVVSYLEAGRPYKLLNSNPENSSCPDNIVFNKHCLIIPRGELLWSLLAIPGDKIAVSNNANNFRIFIHPVEERDRLEKLTTVDDEFKLHKQHLGLDNLKENTSGATQKTYYVTLNPFLYTRIRSFRCIPPEGRSLDEQHFMIHKMNAFYTHSLGAISLLSTNARRLLQYAPGTREILCTGTDKINVGIPKKFYEGTTSATPSTSTAPVTSTPILSKWARSEEDERGTDKFYGYDYDNKKLPVNTIVFPEAKEIDVCKSNRKDFHSFIQYYEQSMMTKIREEYADIKSDDSFKLIDAYDNDSKTFWYKLIKNTYPSKLTYKEDTISQFTPNCMLTPLGVVAIRDICLNDPLIFEENTMEIDKINKNKYSSNWECSIETLEMPDYKRIANVEKAGEPSNPPPRVQANPMAYSSAFVTSIGTNITILPTQK